jgi:hypothetical protein
MNHTLFNMLSSPYLIFFMVPTIAISAVVDIQNVVEILFWLFLFDLFTGVSASYFDWKKTSVKDSWFFGNGEGFSSEKFKKCFVKIIVYAGTPWIVLKFQNAFLIKNFKIESISDSEFNITIILLLLFCANETFSIFWENLPKCGINIPKAVKDLIVKIKEIKKIITD